MLWNMRIFLVWFNHAVKFTTFCKVRFTCSNLSTQQNPVSGSVTQPVKSTPPGTPPPPTWVELSPLCCSWCFFPPVWSVEVPAWRRRTQWIQRSPTASTLFLLNQFLSSDPDLTASKFSFYSNTACWAQLVDWLLLRCWKKLAMVDDNVSVFISGASHCWLWRLRGWRGGATRQKPFCESNCGHNPTKYPTIDCTTGIIIFLSRGILFTLKAWRSADAIGRKGELFWIRSASKC